MILNLKYLVDSHALNQASQVEQVVKNLPANAGDITDMGSSPGLGRSRGEGNGNPFKCSCLENPMYRGAWHATVHRFAKNQTQPKQHSTHTQTYLHMHLTSNCLFIEYISKLKS